MKHEYKYEYHSDNELKNEFLSTVEEKYSKAKFNLTTNVLSKIDDIEGNKEKKIYFFTLDEIKEFLLELQATSITTLNTYYSTLKKYVDFVSEKHPEKEIDLVNIKKLSSKDMINLINQEAHKERYITREELFKLISNAVNPQDKALFLLLFEGVRGKDYDTLRLLEEKHINFEENTIELPNKTIKIKDRRTMFILKSAIRQTEYYYERKNKDTDEMEIAEYNISPNNYFVIKRVIHNNLGLEPYVPNRIKVKIQKFARELGREYLTGNTIYNSGLAERFLEHFDYRAPETITTKEIKQFLVDSNESIPPATLRRIANYILEQ